MPLPSKFTTQHPNAQFCAPGGFSQEIFEASHCQKTGIGRRPTRAFAIFHCDSSGSSHYHQSGHYRTTGRWPGPQSQPLSLKGCASPHCTKAFGPAAQKPAEKSVTTLSLFRPASQKQVLCWPIVKKVFRRQPAFSEIGASERQSSTVTRLQLS